MGCQYGYGNGFDENSKVWALFRSRGIVPDYKSMIVVNMLGQRCGNEDLLISSRCMPKSYDYFGPNRPRGGRSFRFRGLSEK